MRATSTHRAGPSPDLSALRVVAGGLLAGIVLIVVNLAAQAALEVRVQRDLDGWMPGAAAQMAPAGPVGVVSLVAKLVLGMVLVWLVAAARPAWGSGLRTIVLVAVTAWVLGAIFLADFPVTGMMSWSTYALLEAWQLVAFVAATWVGTRCYCSLMRTSPA